MEIEKIKKIFDDTDFVRYGGGPDELRTAEYFVKYLADMGVEARIESFDTEYATMKKEKLYIDGQEIPCVGYWRSGSCDLEAPLYYMASFDKLAMSKARGKIVLMDGGLGKWRYEDMMEAGMLGYITYDGNAFFENNDIGLREQTTAVSSGNKIPAVNINVKDALKIVNADAKTARIVLDQEDYTSQSRNVIAELPGEVDEYITLSAHYDSVTHSHGAWDNMSGAVSILGIFEYFMNHPHRYGIRLVLCGSEERGLLGSHAYCDAHEDDLKKTVLNVNVDMVGCTLGKFIARVTAEDKLVHYVEYMGDELGFSVDSQMEVYPSDSTAFADKGVPALSFARIALGNAATCHNRFDTKDQIKPAQMAADIDFMTAFTDRMANAAICPVSRTIPDEMKEKLDNFMLRKRPETK